MRTSALSSVLLMLDSRCQTERQNGLTGGQLDDTTESDVTGARSLSSVAVRAHPMAGDVIGDHYLLPTPLGPTVPKTGRAHSAAVTPQPSVDREPRT